MSCFRCVLLISLLLFSCPSRSEGFPPPAKGSEVSLERLIQDYETVEQELGKAQESLKASSTTASERRRIEAWIRELQHRQQDLVDAIEKKAGPLPPAVRDQPAPPGKRLDSQEIRDEAILEKDVKHRLP